MIQQRNISSPTIVKEPVEQLDLRLADDMQEFQFFGRHLLASYNECADERLLDHEALLGALKEAIALSGATILKSSEHTFEGGGLTAVFLLSESHASIHTYPEHHACFVDMFTCGTTCRVEEFDRHMRQYLQSKQVSARVLTRHQEIED